MGTLREKVQQAVRTLIALEQEASESDSVAVIGLAEAIETLGTALGEMEIQELQKETKNA